MDIVLPADLNMEDDLSRGLARLPAGLTVHPGELLVAGRPGLLARVIVEEVTEGVVYFRQVDNEPTQ